MYVISFQGEAKAYQGCMPTDIDIYFKGQFESWRLK